MQAVKYQVDDWRRQDWLKGTRYYSSELRQNLFGQWVVLRRWGRVRAKQGQSLEHTCQNYQEGLTLLSAISKRRTQRGYRDL